MIKAVLFDMDGTIVDSMGVWKYAGSTYVRSLGLVPERDLDDKIFHMNMTQFIDYIKKTYSIDTTFDNILADINNQMTRLYATVGQKSGARELLTALKNAGFILVLATASGEDIAKPVLSRLSMWELFDFHYCNIAKSKPDIFYKIAGDIGVKADECCIVEDTLSSAKGAKSAGLKIIGVRDDITRTYQGDVKDVSDLYYMSLNNTDSIVNDIKNLCLQPV